MYIQTRFTVASDLTVHLTSLCKGLSKTLHTHHIPYRNSAPKPYFYTQAPSNNPSCLVKWVGILKGPVYRISLAARMSIKLSHSEVLLGQNHSLWNSMILILTARKVLYTDPLSSYATWQTYLQYAVPSL